MLAKRGWGGQHQQAREEGKGMQCGGAEETTRMSLARTASETLREQPGPLPRTEFTSPQPVLKNKGEGPPTKKGSPGPAHHLSSQLQPFTVYRMGLWYKS